MLLNPSFYVSLEIGWKDCTQKIPGSSSIASKNDNFNHLVQQILIYNIIYVYDFLQRSVSVIIVE